MAGCFQMLLAAAILLCIPLLAQANKQHPLPPFQQISAHDFDQLNVKLDLRFDWEKEQAIGTETFTFSPTIAGFKTLVLDAANMTFNSVKLTSGAPLQFQNDDSKQTLTVTMDRAYQPNEVITIVLDYHTNRNVKGTGIGLTFYQAAPQRSEAATPDLVARRSRIQPLLVCVLRPPERLPDLRDHRDRPRPIDCGFKRQAAQYEEEPRPDHYVRLEDRCAARDIPHLDRCR